MSRESGSSPKKRRTALTVAAAMVTALGLASAPAWAQEESPSPTEAASPTESPTAEAHEDGKNSDFEAPETVDTYVGQSVQVRMNADAQPNSNLANFRWAVTQVNAESLNNLDVAIPLPMDEAPMLRSLTGHGNMATEVDGGVIFEFPGVSSNQTKRVLNLWPQERDLPVNVTSKFWLDGEEVSAKEIVGKSGVTVKAEYVIHNQTIEKRDVKFEDLDGNEATKEVEASLGFVGISKAFIPQAWAQFDAGHGGIFGADGRGNYQTQWISLAFLPFAENGEAHFGWSAVVPGDMKAYIPKMVIEVSPLHVPAHDEGAAEEEASAESSNGVPQPNLDPATSMIHAGIEDLISGVEDIIGLLPEDEGPPKDPLTVRIPTLIDALTKATQAIGEVVTVLDGVIAGGGSGPVSAAVIDQIETAKGDAEAAEAAALKAMQDNVPPCAEKPAVAEPEACEGLRRTWLSAQSTVGAYDTILETIGTGRVTPAIIEKVTELRDQLQAGKDTLDGLIPTLQNLVDTINKANDAAAQAASGKSQISAGIGEASVEVQAYIANVAAVAQQAAAEGKDAAAVVVEEVNTIKAGVAGLKERLAESPLPYGGGMNTVYAPAGDTQAVQDKAVGLLGEKGLAEEGEGVQPTTKLFGAYQFMLDPADTNKPNTIWRILIALILVAGAGLLGARLARNRA